MGSFDISAPQDLQTAALYAVAATGAVLAVLLLLYPDRMAFTSPRPRNVKTMTPNYPLIGNTPWLLSIVRKQERILTAITEVQKTQVPGGQPLTLTIPQLGGRVFLINRPEYLNFVQKVEFEHFVKGFNFLNNFSDLLGSHGIFVADGDVWKKQRKMASHIFSVGNFKTYVQQTIHRDIDQLQRLMSDCHKTGAQINLPEVFFRFTMSSFSQMAFTADLEVLPATAEGMKTRNEFADAFDFAQLVVDNRFVDPFPRFIELFTAQGSRMRKSIKTLREYCYRIIDLRLEARARGESGSVDSKEGKDLLELFMGMGLTRDELLPVVLNFLIAGRDTTAQSLSWMFYELWKHPECVKEIRRTVAEHLDGRQMGYDDMKSLPYLQACFYEAVRLHPAVPKNVRTATCDTTIRPYQGTEKLSGEQKDLPDIFIRKGEGVIWCDYAMARMPENWGPDCEEYKPERFLEKKEDGEVQFKNYGQMLAHMFNAGPRVCLGQTLATFEGMSVVAAILHKYDVVYDDDALTADPPVYADSVTHPIANPYKVGFRPLST
ncbi:cytochrome P450 [Acaromyces ingoldii]|uniref:Cytochrome P450 n=1 Tax=Acaromyces ingoldii TaxID=215250 RepID=A0A316YW71_9BASI|nr:cytochrome P450 [Acaromyces ingoldii]PWN93697.1 cytochrome P450 [Acaromyces ingoldii]